MLRRLERERLRGELDDTAKTLQRDARENELRAAELKRQRNDIERQARDLRAEVDAKDAEKARLQNLADTLKTRSDELVEFHREVCVVPLLHLMDQDKEV